MAAASVFVMELEQAIYDSQTQWMQSHINVGFGSDVSINELAHAVAKVTAYRGSIVFDPSKPDGSPRKWMSSERLNNLGWSAQVGLEQGLEQAYTDFVSSNHLTV
jgi:GDP-L-fucose synthase